MMGEEVGWAVGAVLRSPTVWASWILAAAGLVLGRRGDPRSPAWIMAGAQIAAMWATTGWFLCLTQVSCGTAACDLLPGAFIGVCAAPIPLACAVAGRLGVRRLLLGVLLPWIDYTLLSVGLLGVMVLRYGTGPLW